MVHKEQQASGMDYSSGGVTVGPKLGFRVKPILGEEKNLKPPNY